MIIKFRVWNKEYKEMLNWEDIKYCDYTFHEMAEEEGGFILMQFIGLIDKNGKEIYEGDIIKIKDWNYYLDHEEKIEIVDSLDSFFESKGYAEQELGANWISKNLEIIGNIYDKTNEKTAGGNYAEKLQ